MKTWGVLYTTLAFASIVVAVASAQLPATVPLPADLNIVPPDSGVPPGQAKFSGKWFGVWGGNVLEHVLVVEEINQSGAKVVYAYGIAPSWNIYKPGWFRTKDAHFVEGSLVVQTPRLSTVTYRINQDGTLSATYEGVGIYGSYRTTAKLSKVN